MSLGNKSWVKCKFTDCFKCCLETEMLLTPNDIQQIKTVGYNLDDFMFENSDGFFQLKNVKSETLGKKCFFLSDNGKCKLVLESGDIRPRGCKIYPLIVDLNVNTIIVDDDCREKVWFMKQEFLQEQYTTVTELVNQLLEENGKY